MHKLWIAIPLAALAFLDSMTLARSHSEAEDAAQYILNVTNGDDLFHSNHLLYGPVNWVNFRLWEALGYAGDAVVPMQVLSVSASLVSVWLVYRIALRVGASLPLSLAATGWVAFSFGFWVYSLEADTYLLPIPFLLWSVMLMLDVIAADASSRSRTFARLSGLGAVAAMAALLHQQYVFLLPVIAITFVIVWRRSSERTSARLLFGLGVFLASSWLLIAVTYCVVGRLAIGLSSPVDIVSWARGHASNGMWEAISAKTPLMMLVGFGRAVFAMNFLFRSPRSSDLMSRVFAGKSLVEERHLAEHGINTVAFLAILLAMAAALAAMAWLLVRLVRRSARRDGEEKFAAKTTFMIFAAVYLLVNVIVIMIWEPGNLEFWIAVMPALAIALAVLLSERTRAVAASFVLVGALFVANLLGAVVPYSQTSNDYWAMQNGGFRGLVAEGDVIVTDCPYLCRGDLALLTDVPPIDASSDDVDELTAALGTPGTDVFVSSWTFDPPPQAEAPTGNGTVRKQLDERRSQLVEVGRSGDQIIYRLERG
ncbi:Glycosyltransferase RgtA/B/C/D-like domain-containing protein OS=Tsukamurella paurometabola (strain ATCC 8368 / DSM / CCUG 35730 / CIP 100753 / JCM 10117/ KCTC 9821 / NBRC 16120 / NCIMB 702349 / NCTC 13040) OX=521096 GN=Tpau_0076 PE=4 SV=1 [Tsukamurella paurometabola]|uniref:Glycosyltransferase RgtA/B/C/D-like domain-containing protein n=2 Tax=Tsukamurella paurometabola TaxID=2061 RepID=D5UPW2_TSUPD|nr:hypothetical protein [Tsukamurella paurometabola]ADG76730.1 hypothetical protein Tpau_0076 [Tsukamurella paurometabola DSM 20162]SUP41387.1 Uncharacterised protein [Tsukamurella paurometabola]